MIGPKRIILINSGKYQYAEVEIDQAVHLVGENNAGKTTLIAILQYLYIDNETFMSFSKDPSVTKKYYFKDEYSYILFECLTPTGYKVVGVHGTSRLGNGSHERFVYEGSYAKEDFFHEDNYIKNSGDVKLSLSDRKYHTMTASQIRAALTGVENSNVEPLNLLPIKNREGYNKFRKLYHNLLDLSNVGQKELKESLIHVCETDFRTSGGIDLDESYSQAYERIRSSLSNIEGLKKLEKNIGECAGEFEEREETRSDLVNGRSKIVELFSQEIETNSEKRDDLKEQIFCLTGEMKDEKEQEEQLGRNISDITKELGGIEKELGRLTTEQTFFREYFPDLEIPVIQGIEGQIKDIEFKLRSIDVEDLGVIKGRLVENERLLGEYENRITNFEYTVANILREDFEDDEIATFFSLYNQRILGLKVSDNSIVINDYLAVKEKIRATLKNIQNNIYIDKNISIPVDGLQPDLSPYIKIEGIEKEIARKQGEIKRDKEVLSAAQEKADLLKRHDSLKDEFGKKNEKHSRYLRFKKEQPQLEILETNKKTKEKEKEGMEVKLKEIQANIKTKETNQNGFTQELDRIDKIEKRHRTDIQNLSSVESEWLALPEYEFEENNLDELISYHRSYAESEKSLSNSIKKNLWYIEKITYGKYTGTTEEETLENLTEELGNLDKQEKVVGELWESLLHGLSTNMRDMLADIETLKTEVSRLTRRLSKIQISDLSSLKIVVEDKKNLTELMRGIVKNSSRESLFSFLDVDKSTAPIEELQKQFMAKGKIEIADLFSLKFVVKKADNSTEKHDSLKNVESNGTTITIKVLVNLMLMKGLFDPNKEVSIPFYLDEVGNLDSNNGASIVEQALELGFTPIVASPEPMNIVEKLYFLRGGQEGLYVDSRNLMDLEAN